MSIGISDTDRFETMPTALPPASHCLITRSSRGAARTATGAALVYRGGVGNPGIGARADTRNLDLPCDKDLNFR